MVLGGKIIHNKWLISGLSIVTILTLLAALFSDLTPFYGRINLFFCSDTLYLPAVYKDLFVHKTDFHGWHLNAAPNFFPDMTFYFLLMFITNNFIVSSFIFSIVQVIGMGFLFVKIFQLIFPASPPYYKMLIYTLLCTYLLEPFFFSKDFYYTFNLIVNGYHTSSFIMTLVCLILTIKFIKNSGWTWLILLFLAGFLSIVSDRLFIVFYAVPVCMSCVFLYKRLTIKTSLALIVTNILMVSAGMFVFKQIDMDTYGFMTQTGKPAQLKIITEQFGIYFRQMGGYLTEFGFKAFTIYLFIAAFFLVLYVLFNSWKTKQNPLIVFYALFTVLFSITGICAPMLSGKYVGGDCMRYNIYPVYLAILNVAVFIFYKFKNTKTEERSAKILVGVNVLLFITALSLIKWKGLKDYFNYYPEIVRQADAIAEREHLEMGVANFWEAKKITVFSKKGLRVYSVFDDTSIYDHAANVNCFYDNRFNFVVLNGFNDTVIYSKRLRGTEILAHTNDLHIAKSRPFTYLKGVGYTSVNINE